MRFIVLLDTDVSLKPTEKILFVRVFSRVDR